jgi:hypothetical protein
MDAWKPSSMHARPQYGVKVNCQFTPLSQVSTKIMDRRLGRSQVLVISLYLLEMEVVTQLVVSLFTLLQTLDYFNAVESSTTDRMLYSKLFYMSVLPSTFLKTKCGA